MEPKSNFLTLNWKDILKGFVVAIVAALLTGVYEAIQLGGLEFTWLFWKPVLITSLGAGVAYLIKNVFTNNEDKILTKDA